MKNFDPPGESDLRHFGVRIFDILFGVLVFFPLFTGGVWIQRPHLFIELSDVGLSIVCMGILAAALSLVFRVPLGKSWTLSVVSRGWEAWRQALEKDPCTVLGLGSLGVGLLWSVASCLRHESLNSHAFDLGIFSNAVWHMTRGDGPWSSVKGGISLFADHQSPILAIFAPAFWIWPDARLLLIAQGFGLAAGAIPLFWLGRQYRTGAWGAALPLFYWAWLPLRNANAFDFHPEVFMLPLFLAAILGLQGVTLRSRLGGALAFLLALGAKESAGPVAFGIGVAWCLGAGPMATRQFTRRLGAFAALLGLAVFWLDIKVVPGLFGAHYAYQGAFAQYGDGFSQWVLAPFTKPGLFFSQLLGPARLKFLFGTLASLGFLPLLNPATALAALPGYLMLFLSAGDHRVNLGYHYAIEPGVGLFWALPGACAIVARQKNWLLTGAILFFAAATFGRSELNRIRRNSPTAQTRWVTTQFLPCVDPALSVAASEALVPHLASRAWVHPLEASVAAASPSGPAVACVIEDRAIGNSPMTALDFDRLGADLARLGYRPVYSCGELKVFAQPGASCLWCEPSC